jgi:hypothetical protein
MGQLAVYPRLQLAETKMSNVTQDIIEQVLQPLIAQKLGKHVITTELHVAEPQKLPVETKT